MTKKGAPVSEESDDSGTVPPARNAGVVADEPTRTEKKERRLWLDCTWSLRNGPFLDDTVGTHD